MLHFFENGSNTFLLPEEQMIHILYLSSLRLYRSLLSRFILPEVISESGDMLSINLEDLDVLKDFNTIFIRAMTKQGTVTSLEPKKLKLFSLNVQSTCKHQCQY